MNYEKVELVKEIIRFLKCFKDKDEGIKTLEILVQDDPDALPILNRLRKEKSTI
jgi:hypothetical protein